MNKKILANENLVIDEQEKQNKKEKIEIKFKEILDIMGYDVERDTNLMDTPKRVSKMFIDEIFKGNFTDPPKITIFPNTRNYDEMVILKDIEVKSTCSHHFQPFIGTASIVYMPDKKIIGLSKLSRIVDFFSRRPQIQEELTIQIADFIEKLLEPKGLGLVIDCQHFCMKVRGVEEHDSHMITSVVRGVFKENIAARQEFLSLIN